MMKTQNKTIKMKTILRCKVKIKMRKIQIKLVSKDKTWMKLKLTITIVSMPSKLVQDKIKEALKMD